MVQRSKLEIKHSVDIRTHKLPELYCFGNCRKLENLELIWRKA